MHTLIKANFKILKFIEQKKRYFKVQYPGHFIKSLHDKWEKNQEIINNYCV